MKVHLKAAAETGIALDDPRCVKKTFPESTELSPRSRPSGEVWFDPIFPKTDGVDVGTVIFSPNGRTVWRQHEYGQLLQITSGYGFVCKEGEAPQRVRAGDTVWIAPNERHWHGATASTLMSHTTTTSGATEFHQAVTEAEYAAANATARG